jgi:phage recombination protein Bet
MSLVNPRDIRAQVDLIKRTVAKGCTDLELELFIKQCERTGLDPFARQIYAIKRYDSQQRTEVMQTQVSIDGLRTLAANSAEMAGQDGPYWCGPDGLWRDVWLGADPPSAAKVTVLRDLSGLVQGRYTGVALWDSYCQTTREGRPTRMWAQMGPEMLAKCAEALALRKAFPQSLSGLYTGDEMGQVSNEGRPNRPSPEPNLNQPLSGPETVSKALPAQSPILPPPRPVGAPTAVSEGAPVHGPAEISGTLGFQERDPLGPMRSRVSLSLGRLSVENRSAVLAKGDAEHLQLPEEASFTSDHANRWLDLIKDVDAP